MSFASNQSRTSQVLLALVGLDALLFIGVLIVDRYLQLRSLGVYVLAVCSVGAGILLTIALVVSVLVDRTRH
jgi:hypothetical protein